MLVVDRSVFAQLQADHTGIDFMELSASLIRTQAQPGPRRRGTLPLGSTPSILDSDTTSKGVSPTSLGFSPPAYEDIFGSKNFPDLPPSYSEVSLMLRQLRNAPPPPALPSPPPPPPPLADEEDVELRSLGGDPEAEAAGDAADGDEECRPRHAVVDIPETSVPYRSADSDEDVCIDESVL